MVIAVLSLILASILTQTEISSSPNLFSPNMHDFFPFVHFSFNQVNYEIFVA